MSLHVRQQIRQGLLNALLGETQAGARVFSNRKAKLVEGTNYPSILIYSGSEEANRLTQNPRISVRDYRLTVEVRAIETNHESEDFSTDDALDAVAKEVETVVFDLGNMGGLIQAVTYDGSEPEFNSDGENEFAALRINFVFKYIS